MANGPRVQGALPTIRQPTGSAASPGGLPLTEYMVGRPRPRPVFNLAALFGGSTFGPRVSGPWQSGPTQFVGGTNVYGTGGIDAFVEGGHAWSSGGGFPHGDAWPGWPDDW